MIFFVPKYEGDDYLTCLNLERVLFKAVLSEWKRNYGSDKKPDYRPLCTYYRRIKNGKLSTNYDLHYVNPRTSDGGTADVGFYVLKYMLKPSVREVRLQRAFRLNLPEDEYERSWQIVKSKSFYSKGFGLNGKQPSQQIIDYLKRSIRDSKQSFPEFINPVDGKKFPLSRYYKSKGFIYGVGDALDFYYRDMKARVDNVIIQDDRDESQCATKVADFNSKVNQVFNKSIF